MNEAMTELMRQAQDRHEGASGRRLAEIADAAGHQIDRTQVNHLLAGTYTSRMRRPALDAIAFLSGKPRDTVYRLAHEAVPGAPFAPELPAAADTLSVEQRKAVLAIVREFVNAQQASAQPTIEESAEIGVASVVRMRPGTPPRAVSGRMTGRINEATRILDAESAPTVRAEAAHDDPDGIRDGRD